MNLRASAIVLRPRTVAEILDLACRLVATRALDLYARLAAILLVPCFVVGLFLRYGLGLTWAFVWLVAAGAGTLIEGVFTVAVGRLLFSESLTARETLRAFAGRLVSYVGALLFSRLLLAATALTAIAIFFAWPRLFFIHEASLLEGASAGTALRRSDRLATGRAATVLFALVALLAAQGAFIGAAELLGHGLVDEVLQLGKPFGGLLDDGGSPYALAGYLLSVPYAATARFLFYIDSRTRADGWDVQLRFMAIAARDAAERSVTA